MAGTWPISQSMSFILLKPSTKYYLILSTILMQLGFKVNAFKVFRIILLKHFFLFTLAEPWISGGCSGAIVFTGSVHG